MRTIVCINPTKCCIIYFVIYINEAYAKMFFQDLLTHHIAMVFAEYGELFWLAINFAADRINITCCNIKYLIACHY